MKWPTPQPIETAPKDRRLLLYRPACEAWDFGKWDDDRYSKKPRPYWNSWVYSTLTSRNCEVTHWLPDIPSPVLQNTTETGKEEAANAAALARMFSDA